MTWTLLVYIDDVLVASVTEEHVTFTVFNHFKEYVFFVNPDKLELKFFRHVVKKDGIHPLSSKVMAIQHFPQPTSQ